MAEQWEDCSAEEHLERLPDLVREHGEESKLTVYRDGGWSAGAHEAQKLCDSVREDVPVVVVNWTHLSSGEVTVNKEGEVEGSFLLDELEEGILSDFDRRVESMLDERVAFLSTTSLWEGDLEKCEGR